MKRWFRGEKAHARAGMGGAQLLTRGAYIIIVARLIPGGGRRPRSRRATSTRSRGAGSSSTTSRPASSGRRTPPFSATSAARRSRPTRGRDSSSRSWSRRASPSSSRRSGTSGNGAAPPSDAAPAMRLHVTGDPGSSDRSCSVSPRARAAGESRSATRRPCGRCFDACATSCRDPHGIPPGRARRVEITVDGAQNVARAARMSGHRLGPRCRRTSSSAGARLPVQGGRRRRPGRRLRACEGTSQSSVCAKRAGCARGAAVISSSAGRATIRRSTSLRPSTRAHLLRGQDPLPDQVGDLASALLELAGWRCQGVLHVAGPDRLSRAELAELVRGVPVARAPAPSRAAARLLPGLDSRTRSPGDAPARCA